jgi:hypothetical protein
VAGAVPTGASRPGTSIPARLREELRDYAVVAGYLYVCLAVIAFYRAAILRDVGVTFSPLGFALVKALVLGKFALLGKAAGLGDRVGGTVQARIAWKSVLFALLLIALSAVEELVVAWLHTGSFRAAVAEVAALHVLTVLADEAVLLLVAIPLLTAVELSRALGPGRLGQLLRQPPAGHGEH